jgi:D-3-phosphoglycerate dehydrogenase / 2-oxoglutarate reductase
MIVAMSGQYAPDLRQRLESCLPVDELTNVLGSDRAGDVGVLITRGKLIVDLPLLEKLPELRMVIKAGAGLDTIDTIAAQARGIQVAATGSDPDSVAELALTLLLSCLRHVRYFDDAIRRDDWSAKERLFGDTISSRRIGIIGFGRIGQSFARMVSALGAQTFVWDRSTGRREKNEAARRIGAIVCADLHALLACSDTVSLHLPLTPATRGLLGPKEFSAIRQGSILINTARAILVDHDCLLAALTTGHLRAAGLDVHYAEGRAVDDPIIDLPNVVLTPHVGAQTCQAHEVIADRIVELVRNAATSAREVTL